MSLSSRFKIIPQILWHEGMMLSPQHFQQNDQRYQQLLSYYTLSIGAYSWGIKHMNLDIMQLAEGKFRILEIEAIMPDGFIVHYNSHDDNVKKLEIELYKNQTDTQKNITTIYLCMPVSQQVTSYSVEENKRFDTSTTIEVEDNHVADNKIEIPVLRPNLFLSAEDKIPLNCVGFPIAKIVFDETFKLTNYMAPHIFVSNDTLLWKQCRNIAQKIREKASYLSGIWQTQSGSPMIGETETLLRPLIMALPSIESILNTPFITPHTLFRTMIEIAGILSPLRYFQLPPIFQGYDHHNISDSFNTVFEVINDCLNGIEQSYAIFPFKQEERLFYLYLNSNQVQSKLYVGVRIPKGATAEIMEEWMMDAVISSDFAVDLVRSRRITGARRSRISNALESEMMPIRGAVIFEVDFDLDFIAGDQNLNIFNPSDTAEVRPYELVLYVRRAGVLESVFVNDFNGYEI